ncbi:MAG: DNA mismatch repair protein MutS [Puniceicoccales bacterium]|jgi:DNA mismatch repair protein MutS|nr:DNA mismatch repair protein MutS [Puniceicoccales bacterium]
MKKLTPMMNQYEEVRKNLPVKTLLFFRLGDFYELFNEDAKIASQMLGLALTHRQESPMAGIPHHCANGYIKKVLANGYKVAICDQLDQPEAGKIVRRALTRIYSPGTVIEDDHIEACEHHYMLAFDVADSGIVAAWLDLCDGELKISSSRDIGELLSVASSYNPREILIREGSSESWCERNDFWLNAFNTVSTRRLTTELPDAYFDFINGRQAVYDTFGVISLAGFSVDDNDPALSAAGALLTYASKNLQNFPQNIRSIRRVDLHQNLFIDGTTLSNLEIFTSSHHSHEGSLFHAVNRTQTSAGSRLLREYLSQPQINLDEINRRQSLVEEFYTNETAADEFRVLMGYTRDMIRMLGRLQNRIRNPRDAGGIMETLVRLPHLVHILGKFKGNCWAKRTLESVDTFENLRRRLSAALVDTLPNDTGDGGFIADGFDEKLDQYRALLRDGENWLKELEVREQKSTGIRSLHIRNNGAFGYFIEVSKSYLSLVPAHYVRRQTLVNGERYTTEELRNREREIIDAEQSMLAREKQVFEMIVGDILGQSDAIYRAAQVLAELDVYAGWAILAREWNYVRPVVDGGDNIEIMEGRHPVIEQLILRNSVPLAGTRHFVCNDTQLSSSADQIMLITGPNMAGKSTYIRQIALITLLAYAGSWVPATRAHIGKIDRIFSRIGSGDDLSRGRSTFLVEMQETAAILRTATAHSLIILDEVGRGTSTYDGLSIAWSVIEYLHGKDASGPITLFATHYQELTQLESLLPRIRNAHMQVAKSGDEILFLRKIADGPTNRAYGIYVAKLAGLPDVVIQRAQEILTTFMENDARMGKSVESRG